MHFFYSYFFKFKVHRAMNSATIPNFANRAMGKETDWSEAQTLKFYMKMHYWRTAE